MSSKYSHKLQGKRVLVIGGTSGIGFCVAEACVEFGAIVTVAGSRQESVDHTIKRLAASYPNAKGRVSGLPCNLAGADMERNLRTLFDFATKDGEKLDYVVNTAGDRFDLVKINDVTASDIQKRGQVRFVGTLIMAKLAPQYMYQTNLSSITFTGGANSTRPGPGWGAIAGRGAAKEGMARALAVDLKPMRVNCVSPGAIETELWDSFGGGGRRQQIRELYGKQSLVGTVGKPEDMAEAYLYLMRDAYVDGITVLSDGGWALV